jgi:AraC-like DNA-binding protein
MRLSNIREWPSRAAHLPTGGTAEPRGRRFFLGGKSAGPRIDASLADWLRCAEFEPVNAYEWTCSPRWRVAPRRVGDDMWFYIRAGACRCQLGEDPRWRPLPAGSLLLIPRRVRHALEPHPRDGRVECATAHFFLRGYGGCDLLALLDAGGIYAGREADFAAANRSLAREFSLKRPGWRHAMAAAAWTVLLDILRHRPAKPRRVSPDLAGLFQRLRPVFDLIGDRLGDPALRVDELAMAIHVTGPHLRRLVRQTAGCGVAEYIQQRRLERACRLLVGTRAGLKRIVEEAGFPSPASLHRLFRRRLGMTPAAYRRQAWR